MPSYLVVHASGVYCGAAGRFDATETDARRFSLRDAMRCARSRPLVHVIPDDSPGRQASDGARMPRERANGSK